MPMLDLDLPDGVLGTEAERELVANLTNLLLRWEGADPRNARVRGLAWVFVNRIGAVYVAGEPVADPHYRVRVSVPQGQFDDERRAGMVSSVTEAVLDAEAGRFTRDTHRVWVFANEVPEGTWGAGGRVWRLADIAGFALGDEAAGRAYAERTLANRAPAPV